MSLASRPAALAFIFVTVVVDVLALGIVIPVLPRLIEAFEGGDTAQAARVYGLIATVWALMQFVCAPLLGALSDRFGRRPVILLSCLGLGLDYVLMALAPNLAWLFVGRVLSGIFASSVPTAGAYIADVAPPERRAASFGLIGAAFGLGFVLGPALGGLLGALDPRLPFWAAAALAFVNFAYGVLVLPESLPRERRSAFSWRRANPFGALRLLRSHRELAGLACVNGLFWIAHHALASVFVLYVGYRYGWDTLTVGLTLAAVGVGGIVVQGGLVRPVVAAFGERPAVLGGLAAGALGFVVYALAPTGAAFWAGIPVFALLGFYGPAAQALMSKRVGVNEQGRLQGANQSITALTALVGPGIFTQAFAWSIAPERAVPVPGAVYLLAAAVLLAALALAWRATRR